VNQSYQYTGVAAFKKDGTIKALTSGSAFTDRIDSCDGNECAIVCVAPAGGEAPKGI